MKKLEILSEKLEESGKDVISINDPDARFMKNKKGNWKYDYNGQIAVDEYKGIIIASHITNNPTDHYGLIPLMEQVQENLTQTNIQFSPNFQVSADNGYSTDINTEYLEQKGLDGHISSRKLSRQNKKYNLTQKPFSKDNFAYNHEINTYQSPLGQPLYKQKEYEYRNKKNNILDKRMQKLPRTRILRQKPTIQNNRRLWKPIQNQNATKKGNKRSTKNYMKTENNNFSNKY